MILLELSDSTALETKTLLERRRFLLAATRNASRTFDMLTHSSPDQSARARCLAASLQSQCLSFGVWVN